MDLAVCLLELGVPKALEEKQRALEMVMKVRVLMMVREMLQELEL